MAGQVWATSSLGGYMYALNLSKELRMQLQPLTKFRQFCDVKDGTQQGLHRGATFHWNIYMNVATQGGSISETQTVPRTNFTIVQGTLTITEYANAVPYSQKLDNLSEHPVREIIRKVLKHDAKKAFDIASHAQFNTCKLRAVSTASAAAGFTTNGTATLTNTSALYADNHKLIVDWMKERNIPGFEGDDYYVVAHPSTLRALKDDLESIHQYTTPGFRLIKNGEMGRYESSRFVEQTNIAKATWGQSKSNWAFYMGEDTVAEAIAVPEEMRGAIPSDFGRAMGICWYYLGGFGIVHTQASESRILKWDSAA